MSLARIAVLATLITFGTGASAQAPPGRGPENELLRQGSQLDLQGKFTDARALFQKAIDTAENPGVKANAQRAMAMSYAFEGDCKRTADFEAAVIAYWKTQEKESPENAFYQQGKMADEAARVCIDAGDLDAAAGCIKRAMI